MTAKPHRSSQNAKRMQKGIFIFLIIVVLYTIGWFYLASVAKDRVRNELAQQGDTITCQNLSARGYPFSLYISCKGITYSAPQHLVNFAANTLDIGTSIFSPHRVQARLTSPATLAAGNSGALKAEWKQLHTSARINGHSARNISLKAEDLHIQEIISGDDTRMASGIDLAGLQFDLNAIEEPLQIKTTFDKLRLTGNTPLTAIPELDGLIDISSPFSLASFSKYNDQDSRLRGKSIQLNQLLLLLPTGANISISGPLSVDEEGLANADLKIRLTNPATIGAVLQAAFPDQGKNINTAVFALASMPKDEAGATIVPVIIKNGKISAGFIPLGRLPRL